MLDALIPAGTRVWNVAGLNAKARRRDGGAPGLPRLWLPRPALLMAR